MPEKVKKELAAKSKEYAEYKTYESYYLEKEKSLMQKTKENTFNACKFYPSAILNLILL